MNFCKVCFKDIKDITWHSVIHKNVCVCPQCFSKMKPLLRIRKAEDFWHISFYEYNQFIKSLIYQYKGCKDVELCDVFLSKQAGFLNLLFNKYVIVPGPSYPDKDTEIDFNHVTEMFRCLKLPIYDCLYKTKNIKQKDLTYDERHQISSIISLKPGADLIGKNVIFADDIFTTGSTAISCANLIKKAGAKKVIIITMSRVVFN